MRPYWPKLASLAQEKKQLVITKTRLFKYIENFTSRNIKFSDKKKSDIFHISAQKHRLWVLVRTASPRRF